MTAEITSPKNPLIKEVLLLQGKARERREAGLVVIEGRKEVSLAVATGLAVRKVLFCPDIIPEEDARALLGTPGRAAEWYEVGEAAFSKISYRETTGGVVVLADMPARRLEDLPVRDQSVYIVLEAVEKPGNLGAICRVADAAQVDGLIVCDPHTDIYNPNAIRASLGCVFTVPVVVSAFDETTDWLHRNRIASYAAELTASEFYHRLDLTGRIALVFGTEATGLTDRWIQGADHRVKIPMRGVIDSLNVNTSVAILTFEAMRQRGFGM